MHKNIFFLFIALIFHNGYSVFWSFFCISTFSQRLWYIDIPLLEIQLVADRTLDEPLYPSIVFESKQYNIIYTYNMGHDLYLPAHVVNTKGWDVFLRQCLLSLLMWAIPQISTFSNYGLCTHTIRSSWKSRGRRNLYFLLLANSTMSWSSRKIWFFMQKFEIFSF